MNLKWNSEFNRFEAEFHDFQADYAAAKVAKFKCDGPPTWVWHTTKALVLKYLREHKPPVLTITPEARAQYERLLPVEEKNAEVRAALKEAKKGVKKQRAKVERQAALAELHIPEKGYIGAEDLPPMPPFISPHSLSRVQSIGVCQVCKEPTYGWPDRGNLCLWCEKQRDEAF